MELQTFTHWPKATPPNVSIPTKVVEHSKPEQVITFKLEWRRVEKK